MRQAFRTLARATARAFAPFQVIDDFGTDQRTYTAQAAAAWLPYCGRVAVVHNRFTGRVLRVRVAL